MAFPDIASPPPDLREPATTPPPVRPYVAALCRAYLLSDIPFERGELLRFLGRNVRGDVIDVSDVVMAETRKLRAEGLL